MHKTTQALLRFFPAALRGVAIALLAVSTTACWESHSYAPDIDETIQIGALVSLSGMDGSVGHVHLAAMECALDDANRELAANGQAVRLTIGDTRSDPYAASILLNSFVMQNVRITVGPFTSGQVAAVEQGIRSSQSLLISPSSTSLDLANRNDHIYRMAPNDSYMASNLVELIWNRGHRVLVLIYRDDTWGNSVAREVEREFTALGGTVVAAHAYGWFDTGDATVLLRQVHDDVVAAAGEGPAPEVAIQLAGMSESAALFRVAVDSVPQLRDVHWFGSDGFVNDWSIFRDPDIAEFAIDVDYTAPSYRIEVPEEHWGVIDRIAYMTGVNPGPYSLLSYDAVRIAARAVASVGQHATYGELESALRLVLAEYEGVSGQVDLDAMGDRDGGQYDFFSVRSDGWTYRWVRVGTSQAFGGRRR